MMTRKNIKKFALEIISILVLSFLILGGSYLIAKDKEDLRTQDSYVEEFSSVLPCASFNEIHTEILKNHKDISNVYLGYDAEGLPVGYVINVSCENEDGFQLHLLVGIDYESSQITGIKRMYDEERPIVIDDMAFSNITQNLKGNRIPVAITNDIVSDVSDDDDEPFVFGNLRDGTYYAQKLYADNKDYIDYVEIEVKSGVITRVQWDAVNLDPTTENRAEASLSGAYSTSGEHWAVQSYNLCHALIECQDPDKLAMKSDGTTEIVEGVTADIRLFVELSKECIYYSQIGYDKNDYMEGLDSIVRHVLGSSAEDRHLINDDGFIVYSFDKNANLYEVTNEDGVVISRLNVYQISNHYGDEEGSPEAGPTATPVPTEMPKKDEVVDGAEDGVVDTGDPLDSILTDSVDQIPMSEIASEISVSNSSIKQARLVVTSINTCYKFLKEYLNWLV